MFFNKRADANSTSSGIPKPRVVDPSGAFDGNDGRWSTFNINIGDPDGEHSQGQNFKVLVSTSSPLTMVPSQSEWCNQDCAKRRGIQVFNGEQPLGYNPVDHSATWISSGIYTVPKTDWWDRGELNGTLGLDNVGLGESSPQSTILTEQLVMTYIFEEFFLGFFGLAAGTVTAGNSARSPFLFNLARGTADPGNAIPSVSYGHTAGASYRNDNKGVVGNLVLGGYDSSRVNMKQAVSIKMPNDKNNTLVVGVQSITYQPDPDVEANNFSFTNETKGFSATIDSTLPYLYLPDAVCDEFALRFGLEFNDKLEIYTVNRTAHTNNERNNATVTFKIGNGPDGSQEFTSIILPYAAFYYTLDKPAAENPTQYFPIRKSSNGIFVLGRTFLQEAYLIVDYERSNFTVAPALHSDTTQDSNTLVPIYNTTYSPPAQSPTPIPSGGGGGGGLSPGAVAGIVVGVVVVFLLAGLAFFFRWKRRRAQRNPYPANADGVDTTLAGEEVKNLPEFPELESEPPNSPKQSILGLYHRDQKDHFPGISELDSPPVELPSPQPHSGYSDGNGSGDYFMNGKPRRRGATRESSGPNTPGASGPDTPVAELPGDDGKFQVGGMHFEPMASPKLPPAHARGPSDTSLHSKIDEVMSRPDASPERKQDAAADIEEEAAAAAESNGRVEDNAGPEISPERRPSHTRGLSDSTVQSDNTAVSQPTPEELEQWAMGGEEGPRRPLSE